MDVIYTFLVDFARPQRTNELLVMLDDHMSRVCRFILMNNGKPMDVSEVDAVSVNAILPTDETIVAEAALSVDDDENPINEVIFRIPSSMTSAIGKTVCTISLLDMDTGNVGRKISSFEFYVQTRNELNSNEEDDDDDIAGLKDLMERAAEAIEVVEQLSAQTALPNPYPLRFLNLGLETINYNGSVLVELDFQNALTRLTAAEGDIDALELAVPTKITGTGIADNDSTNDATYALSAKVGKTHGDEIDGLTTRMGTAEGNITDLGTAVATKITGSGIADNDSTNDATYALSAKVGKTHGDEIDALALRMTAAETLAAAFTSFTIETTDWSSTTTTVDSIAYYTYTKTLTKVYSAHPFVSLGAAGTIPTDTEKANYNLIKGAIANTTANTITFYAIAVPQVDLVMMVREAA